MPDLPSISVVIPAYNAVEHLPAALDSVLAQSYPSEKMEVIVVDDGSTDDTATVARNHLRGASSMEAQVVSVENGGPSRARNIGWRAANGKWIQFLDHDDLLAPWKIEAQTGAASTTTEEVAVVHSDWERLQLDSSDSWVSGKRACPRIGEEEPLLNLLDSDGFIQLGSCLIRRLWLDKVDGFDPQPSPIEDVNLFLRIAMDGGQFKHVATSDPVSYYRDRGDDSLSGQDRVAFASGCLHNTKMVEKYWREKDLLTKRRKKALCDAYFYTARQLAVASDSEFEAVWKRIKGLDSSALPPHPAHFRLASRILGYPRAERLSIVFRQLKAWFGLSVPGFS